MIRLKIRTAEVKRPISPGQTRVVVSARDENEQPIAIFLCGVEPPNAFERRMRESFHTVCSVEDMVEYPVGVSCITETEPAGYEVGTYLYCVQENAIYVRGEDSEGNPVWKPYRSEPGQLSLNVHSHKLPFFRRSTIDIILPNRDFVVQSITWLEQAALRLEKDRLDLKTLIDYE